MEKEVKTAYLLFLIAFMGYLLKYGLNVFLAHQLPAALYGDLRVAIQLLQILVVVTLFGTNVGAQRFLAKFLHSDKKINAVSYVAWNLKLVSITFLISFAIALGAIGVMCVLHMLEVKDIHSYHLGVYMFWIAPVAAIVTLLSSFLLSSSEIFFPTLLSQVFKYCIEISLFVIVSVLFGLTLTHSLTIVSTLFFSYIILGIIAIFFMDANITYALKNAWSKIRGSSVTDNEWFISSSKMIANNIIYAIVCMLDLLIVEMFDPHEETVGYYAAALTISGIMWLAPTNLYQAVKPKVSSLITSSQGIIQLQSMLDSVNKVVIFLSGILGIIIISFSQSLLTMFGPDYEAARVPLIILVIGAFLRGCVRFTSVLLVYTGFEGLQLKVAFFELLILCLLGAPATHFFGIVGMAIVSSSVMIGGGLFAVIIARKNIKIRTALII